MDANQNDPAQEDSDKPAPLPPEQAAPAPDQDAEPDDPTIPANEPPLQEPIPELDESAPIPHLRLAGEPPPGEQS